MKKCTYPFCECYFPNSFDCRRNEKPKFGFDWGKLLRLLVVTLFWILLLIYILK